jgi:hypothetical protein
LRKGGFLAHRSSAVHLVVGEFGRCDSGNPISIWPSRSPVRTSPPSFLQPLVSLPPPLGPTPCRLLLRRHSLRNVAPSQRQQRIAQLLAELDPEGGPLRHEECPGAKVYSGGDSVMLPSLSVVKSGSEADLIGSGGERSRMYRRAARLPAHQNFSSRSLPPLAHGFPLFLGRCSLSHSSPCPRLSAARHSVSSSGGILLET